MIMNLFTRILLLTFTCFFSYYELASAKLSCKDAYKRNVDWFVLYKIPKTKYSQKGFKQPNGGEMAYIDSIYASSKNPTWTLYDNIYRIMIVGKGKDFGAVWLQHSVPQFVQDVREGYKYPDNGRENGQLFMCISFPLQEVEIIAYHLQVQAVNVYQSHPQRWAKDFLFFWNLLNKKYLRNHRHLQVNVLRSQAHTPVLAISKPPLWPNDIYTDYLKSKMNSSITVQSWKNGAGGAQKEFCTKQYSVTDVETIGIRTREGTLYFPSSEDHSKWYVAWKLDVFCISSLNRMLSQKKARRRNHVHLE